MGSNHKVLSLGALAMDIFIKTNILPQDDGFAHIQSERLVPGGSAANLSTTLHNLGVQAYQTGKIGDDEYGKVFKSDLIDNGVKVDYLAVKEGGSTLHNYIITAPGGKHCIFANLGDCVNNLEPRDLPDHVLEGFSCFYTDMFSPRSALWLGRKAQELGIPVVYNMQCAPSFMEGCGVMREDIDEMLSLCDLFISGRDGYFELMGETDYRLALAKLYKQYAFKEGAICSIGEMGAVWLESSGIIEAPAYPVTTVDSTGAGDCFTAGIIYRYFCGKMDKLSSLRFACAIAALKCQIPGPRIQVDLVTVEEFIDAHKGGSLDIKNGGRIKA